MTVRIIIGDVRAKLAEMPDESVHCVVTSPPYWGLRDYGVDGQIGLEPTPYAFVDTMVAVFREVRRVLRADGTLWLNLGDSYATGAGKVGEHPGGGAQSGAWAGRPAQGATGQMAGRKHANRAIGPRTQPNRLPQEGLKPKDLVGVPWRVAFALQADGWWLRQDLIWSKPNPMPESITDRCTKSHEYLFLLSKSERYHYDQAAIAEPAIYAGETGYMSGPKNAARAAANGKAPSGNEKAGAGRIAVGETRNRRTVWTVATQPFSEAHFATFPPALIEPCILAGCPKDGTVLDPFFGAGTTGLVADRLGRNCIGIELNPEYAAIAERRIKADAGMFAEVAA